MVIDKTSKIVETVVYEVLTGKGDFRAFETKPKVVEGKPSIFLRDGKFYVEYFFVEYTFMNNKCEIVKGNGWSNLKPISCSRVSWNNKDGKQCNKYIYK